MSRKLNPPTSNDVETNIDKVDISKRLRILKLFQELDAINKWYVCFNHNKFGRLLTPLKMCMLCLTPFISRVCLLPLFKLT